MDEKSRPCSTGNHQSIKRHFGGMEKNGIQESRNFLCPLSFNLYILKMQNYITRTTDMFKKGITRILYLTYANNQG